MSALRIDARRGLVCLLLALAALGASSCDLSEDIKVAQNTRRLHERLGQSKFEDIYRDAAPEFRRNTSATEFVAKLGEIKSRLGDIQAMEPREIGLKEWPSSERPSSSRRLTT